MPPSRVKPGTSLTVSTGWPYRSEIACVGTLPALSWKKTRWLRRNSSRFSRSRAESKGAAREPRVAVIALTSTGRPFTGPAAIATARTRSATASLPTTDTTYGAPGDAKPPAGQSV